MKYATGIFALVIGIGSIWFSYKMLFLYFKVKNWEKVSAKVLSKEVFEHTQHSASRSKYGVRATYSYSYKNTDYTGNKIYLVELVGGQADHLKETAESKLAEIKNEMNIFVNPAQPMESIMFCDGVMVYIMAFLLGIFAILFGLGKMFA